MSVPSPVEFASSTGEKRHILTVSLEDYFQGPAFRSLLTPAHWSRFEDRVEQNTDRCLELLSKHNAQATFFVSTWLAQRIPQALDAIVRSGHEIASSGLTQRSFRELNEQQLREETRNSKLILEQLTQQRIRGYRVADHRLGEQDLWALRVLAEEGYLYDSSLSPSFTHFHRNSLRCRLHSIEIDGRRFYELPLPSANLLGLQVPIAGGNYFRQIPEVFLKRAISSWIQSNNSPFVFYFRVWDLDPQQPFISGASRLAKLRHYRNSTRMPELLDSFLSAHSLTGISNYLRFTSEPFSAKQIKGAFPTEIIRSGAKAESATPAQAVSLVIPCYNESHSLPYLKKALQQLFELAKDKYYFQFIFVDDGSKDNTWKLLSNLFDKRPDAVLLRHPTNLGITKAILTGIAAAKTEIVCSIDCDCTYDPLDLVDMIGLLKEDVHCVTASPYHPAGSVRNVPKWRLGFSQIASRLYRATLGVNLHTFTSCCRVYRRSSVLAVSVQQSGFVGIAELLGKLHLNSYRIEEYPTTLAVRILGASKMKTVRNIAPHLRLLGRLLVLRVSKRHANRKASLTVPGKASHG